MTGTALVTGVDGQDGSYLVERLTAEGWEVHGVTRRESAGSPPSGPSIVRHVLDLADFRGVAALVAEVRPTEIYNLGAISSVALSWKEPVRTSVLNGVVAIALMDAALSLQERTGQAVRMVQASSAEIFGQPGVVPQDESTRLCPVSPYGGAKAYAHMMAATFRSRGLHVTAPILYSHESPRRPATFVTRKITRAVARIAHSGDGALELGNLEARRDWGWAPDYVDAMVRAARHATADDYVIATGVTHSVAEFVAEAFGHVGITDWRRYTRVRDDLTRPADPRVQVGDAGKARVELGWRPTRSFEETVRAMVDHDLACARTPDGTVRS